MREAMLSDGGGFTTDNSGYVPTNAGSSQPGYGGAPYGLAIATSNFLAPSGSARPTPLEVNPPQLSATQTTDAPVGGTVAGATTNFGAVLNALAGLLGGGASAAQQSVGSPVAVQSSGGTSGSGLLVILAVIGALGYYGYSHGWFGGSK